MLTLAAGPDGIRQPGSVCEVDEAEGKALIAGGFADVVEAPKKVGKPKGASKSDDQKTGDDQKSGDDQNGGGDQNSGNDQNDGTPS